MKYYNRRSIRLKNYDYTSKGFYFLTLLTHRRIHRFGEIENGEQQLNTLGLIAQQCWEEIPKHFPKVKLHEFVIMPDHIHGIIEITETTDLKNKPKTTRPRGTSKTIGAIVRGYKIGVTKHFNNMQNNNSKLWHRDYWDVIINSQKALQNIRQYIIENPKHWKKQPKRTPRKSKS